MAAELQYTPLIQKILEKAETLSDEKLAYFVGCICIKTPPTYYASQLSDKARNALCVAIANDSKLLLRLMPVARLLLLARLKKLNIHERQTLPLPLQTAANDAFDLPLEWNQLKPFWLPAILNLDGEKDFIGEFSSMVGCAKNHSSFQSGAVASVEALALILVLDPRFEKGFVDKGHPTQWLARLDDAHRTFLINKHKLADKIKAYHALAENLSGSQFKKQHKFAPAFERKPVLKQDTKAKPKPHPDKRLDLQYRQLLELQYQLEAHRLKAKDPSLLLSPALKMAAQVEELAFTLLSVLGVDVTPQLTATQALRSTNKPQNPEITQAGPAMLNYLKLMANSRMANQLTNPNPTLTLPPPAPIPYKKW